MTNISLGGCGIESEVSPAPAQHLRLYMLLPATHTTLVVDVAPVRWALSGRFGVEFVRIHPDTENILRQWITALAPKDT